MSPYLPPPFGWDDPEPEPDDDLSVYDGECCWYSLLANDDDSDD